jgi:hypothetical protein
MMKKIVIRILALFLVNGFYLGGFYLGLCWAADTDKEQQNKDKSLETWTVTATKIEGDPDTVPVTVH